MNSLLHPSQQHPRDIEPIIIDIEKAELIANDSNLDRAIREDALVRFVQRNAADLVALLDE